MGGSDRIKSFSQGATLAVPSDFEGFPPLPGVADLCRPMDTGRAMSEGLAILSRGHEAFNRGDMAAVMELAAPDVEWGATGAFPGVEDVYRGPDAIQEWADLIRSEWEEFEVRLAEVLHDGNDVVVVVERLRGRGRASGVEAEMCVFATYWLENGKIKKRAAFIERMGAFEAAGLEE